ncbi:Rrf2 family transcriptional regulator [Nitrospirillum sp. BR 11752]|uniref:BadM/Rrf2 family transcriptional regulator n=1 Tax=Nitrospirillum amazonense TaxID=28077 RepID=A0A560GSL9_9PROT|nr:Rrf2 family transcriptional regulator [Nitrospirillum amazonense]MEE3627734.1 Rrf2 family transcriptional regulator [Nitrospirillum sp. BR 11752]TWB36514.1 BadM/Rrf2 family transcriptional regulator [Nitrospirillum amazonense]
MRLSSYTDYALRTLVFLALKSDGLATINDVAQTYDISKNHLMKVVHQLSLLGYVETVRGRGGGLRLGRKAEDIRLGEVIRATEQELDILECFSDSSPALCRLNPTCVLKSALKEALQAFLAVLDDYTLADLVKPRRTLTRLLDLPLPGTSGPA